MMKWAAGSAEARAMGFRRVKVAAISMKPRKWETGWNVKELEKYFRKAARAGAEIAVAPEGVIEGYLAMEVFCNGALAPKMLAEAQRVNGPVIRSFQRLARGLKICLVFGFAERDHDEVFNSAIFIDGRGRICGVHRKADFAEGHHRSWHYNRMGNALRAFDTPYGRAGICICAERFNPHVARALVLDGARFLLIPSFGSRRRAQNTAVIARARENGVPIVEAAVGLSLIVNQGEKAAYQWGCDRVTIAEIDIPVPPSAQSARAAERYFLRRRPGRMASRRREYMKRYGFTKVPIPSRRR